MRLAGRVAVVTGSTRGVGRQIALTFAGEGCDVVVAGRNAVAGEAVADEVRALDRHAVYVSADNSQEADVQNLISRAIAEFGRIDILVNNAAAIDFVGSGGEKRLIDQTTEGFDYILKVDLYGTFWACKYAIPHMIAAGQGCVITISSVGATFGHPGAPSYAAAKGAIESLTRTIAVEYGKDGIRANAIRIGFAFHEGPVSRSTVEVYGKAIQDKLLTRLGTAEDIAQGALYLAAESGGHVTGTVLVIDGGWSAQDVSPDWQELMNADSTHAAVQAAATVARSH
jgi:meso-butanediol dehydrogenase / (S,S)-butanediol dehydrogenase / diacetyl reductase